MSNVIKKPNPIASALNIFNKIRKDGITSLDPEAVTEVINTATDLGNQFVSKQKNVDAPLNIDELIDKYKSIINIDKVDIHEMKPTNNESENESDSAMYAIIYLIEDHSIYRLVSIKDKLSAIKLTLIDPTLINVKFLSLNIIDVEIDIKMK